MIDNKLSPQLQLALRYENILTNATKSIFISSDNNNLWEIVLEYTGDLQAITNQIQFETRDLQGGFAQGFIEKDQIGALSNIPQVVYISLPTKYAYIDIGLGQVCGNNLNSVEGGYNLDGSGVLLAVIDSGITYNHPDFINEQGESRIDYLWDQTLTYDGNDQGRGRVFTKEQINEALRASTRQQQLQIIPSVDTVGHGTAITGIAAGNGRGSSGNSSRGVAPNCELIIVKAGTMQDSTIRDVDIMAGINFSIARAQEMGMPLTILLGTGNNLTGHDGSAALERYINARYNSWLCNIVVGTGNEGDQDAHVSGVIEENHEQTVELTIEGNKENYACCLWNPFSDSLSITIEAPTGEITDALTSANTNRAYLFDETVLLINFSEPTTSIERQQVFISFEGQGGQNINQGIWRITIRGITILQGNYNIWGEINNDRNDRTRFLTADSTITLTSPATANKITSVGAYNSGISQIAAFSGRGYTADGRIKPDVVAPGVDIIASSSVEGQLYQTITGSSAAAAFVAGAYVILMNYGILQLNNINLYGETLKIYLLRTARRPSQHQPYPNNSWGFGSLCIEAALNLMTQMADNTN